MCVCLWAIGIAKQLNICTHSKSSLSFVMSSSTEESDEKGFLGFFDKWIVEQKQHLRELSSAAKRLRSDGGAMHPKQFVTLIRVVEHYNTYCRVKSKWSKHDILAILSPLWTSPLEGAFLWTGGWCPTTAFHLLYSKAGLQLDAWLSELTEYDTSVKRGDLGDLDQRQLSRIDQLQSRTMKEERDITEKMAKKQDMRDAGEKDSGFNRKRLESSLKDMEGELEEIVEKANSLRIATLRAAVDILSQIQAAHFLIAAAELPLEDP